MCILYLQQTIQNLSVLVQWLANNMLLFIIPMASALCEATEMKLDLSTATYISTHLFAIYEDL